MPPSADVAPLPAMATAAHKFALLSWDGSLGRRACPLATFGSREPQKLNVRLACAEPPRADQPELKNAAELRGAIALVVRGGCSFAHKARLLQRAGAVAMLLANNTREEPLAAFTMGESLKELADNQKNEPESITIPCVMMCLRDVRELFQKFPPSVKNGKLCFEILQSNEEADAAEMCLKVQRELHDASVREKRWKGIKLTTSSFLKRLEPHHMADDSVKDALSLVNSSKSCRPASQEHQQPPLSFVQWATSASTYEICFAPLADFCSARAGASYTGRLVACDPLVADRPLKNADQLTGAVALLRRGSCSFPEKLARVQRAGAVAAIVCNDDEEDLDAAFVMSVDHIDAANATLPAVMISHKTFLQIQSYLNVTTARILCRAGQAANGLLELNGKSISFRCLLVPIRKLDLQKDKGTSKADDNTASSPDIVFNLHMACRDGDFAACQRVLASTNGKESKRQLVNTLCPLTGLTALHHACAGGNDNVVGLLLHLGAAPDILDLAMQTPLHIACAENRVKCARLLLRAEASASQVPAKLYNVDEAYGGLPTRQNIGGGTALHEAARTGSSECVELLLSANARLDQTIDEASNSYVFLGVNAKDLEGNTPLHVACANAHAECALYLVAARADINCKDLIGQSPLLLACEAANDPVKEVTAIRIIKMLIEADARVGDCDDESHRGNEGNDRLLLDRLKNLDLRRDLEVMYLRHEAHQAKQRNLELETKNKWLTKSIEEIKHELRTLHTLVTEHVTHESQIEQLQIQMQTILHHQTTCGAPNSLSIQETIVTPLIAERSEPVVVKSDEDLALDAALARDIGKKCLRQSQGVLAEKCFQRSLEVMPLPGVRQLLVTAQKMQHSDPNNKLMDKDFAVHVSCTNGKSLKPEMTPTLPRAKAAKIQKIVEMIRITDATPQARAMLNNELNKLKSLADDTDFDLACRWTEWLVALPWGNASFGLHSDDWFIVKKNEFQQLDAIDVERSRAHQSQAVRIIQRSFRKYYALHLRARVVAAITIQAVIRGKLARLHIGRNIQQQSGTSDGQVAFYMDQQVEMEGANLLNVDYTKIVDPLIQKKLPCQYDVEKLIVGKMFPSRRKDKIEFAEKNMRIVQLVKCVLADTAPSYRTELDEAQPLLFVWTRWGEELDNMCASVLSGPYENQQDAQRRFHRIVCEGETIIGPVAVK